MKKLTKSQKIKIGKEKRINRTFLFGGILFFIFAAWLVYNRHLRDDFAKDRMITKLAGQELSADQICMYGNKIQINKTIAIPIEDEVLYVCCSQCKAKLIINYRDSQFAEDPLTHERIKKADAFAVLANGLSDKVIYFKSGENYKVFINKKSN